MKIYKIGCGSIILGIIMFFIAIYIFFYRGAIFPGMTTIGELSITLWLPTIIFGIVLIIINSIISNKDKDKN